MPSKPKTTATKDDAKPALVPKLRFPEFRGAEGWRLSRLDSLCERIMDGTHFSPKSTEGPRPYLTSKNIRNGHLDLSTVSYISEDEHRAIYARCPVKQNDVLLTKDGANTGNCAINCLDYEFSLLSSVAVLRANRGVIDPAFLFQSISSDRTKKLIEDSMAGQAITRVTLEKISGFVIPVGKPAEQQKIAECLSSVDEVIAAQARKLDALKTHKKGLMQQLFPREGETKPRFPEFRDAGEWEVKPFEEFVTKSFYGTSSSTSPTGKYPVLRMGNMVDGGLDFTNLVYLDLDDDSFESFRLEEGDILLNRTNSPALVGKISIFELKSDCITASYIVTYRLNKKRMVPAFCNFMLNTPLYQSRIQSFARPSVSQANINPTTFKKELIVAVPSLAEQQRIATCLSSLDALVAAETRKLETLKIHKRGLMQQLFPSPEEGTA